MLIVLGKAIQVADHVVLKSFKIFKYKGGSVVEEVDEFEVGVGVELQVHAVHEGVDHEDTLEFEVVSAVFQVKLAELEGKHAYSADHGGLLDG